MGAVSSLVLFPLVWLRYQDRLSKSGDSDATSCGTGSTPCRTATPISGSGSGISFWSTPPELLAHFSSAAAHNDFLRLLVELGWFGVFGFYGLFIVTVLVVWSSKVGRRDYSVIVALAGFLLLSSTDNALATTCYFTLVITAVMAAQPRTKKTIQQMSEVEVALFERASTRTRARSGAAVDPSRWPPSSRLSYKQNDA